MKTELNECTMNNITINSTVNTITAQDLLSKAGLGGGRVSISGLRCIDSGVAAYASYFWNEAEYSPLHVARMRYGNNTHLVLRGNEWMPIN